MSRTEEERERRVMFLKHEIKIYEGMIFRLNDILEQMKCEIFELLWEGFDIDRIE